MIPNEELITFGCPKVGDAAFCDSVGSARRYVNNRDVISRLPLEGLPVVEAYRHVGSPYLIDAQGDVRAETEPAALERLDLSFDGIWEALSDGVSRGRLPRFA